MIKHYHIYFAPKRSVPTASRDGEATKLLYQELVERLLDHLKRAGGGDARTHDDAESTEGHWITLNGAHVFINGQGQILKGPAHLVGKSAGVHVEKPTLVASKGVKNQIHELLTSGHPFTLEELQKATGAKLKQQLFNAINELKKGKGLKIEKSAHGFYHVTNEAGEPVPGLAGLAAVQAEKPGLEPKPEENYPGGEATVTPVDLKPAPEAAAEAPGVEPLTPKPSEPPSPVPAAPGGGPAWSPIMATEAAPPASPMSKADADAAYAKHMAGANQFIHENYKPDNIDALAYAWKAQKSAAMAQWKANTSGTTVPHQPIEVYPADKKLVEALALADTPEKQKAAVDQWKADTAKEKAEAKSKANEAALQATAALQAKPTVEPPVMAAHHVPVGESSFKAPSLDEIVPASHKQIDFDDFKPVAGMSSSKFVAELSKAHKALHDVSPDSVSNKMDVQAALEEHLKTSNHFQWMQAIYGAKVDEAIKKGSTPHVSGTSLAGRLVGAWAHSSGDHYAISVASQLAVRDAFKMHPDSVETKAFHYLQDRSEEQTYKDAAGHLGIPVDTPEKFAAFKQGLQDFQLAQYKVTQKKLADLGIKELYLVRGMRIGSSNSSAKKVRIKMQPASSFSTEHNTALSFSDDSSLFTVKVPASQVLGSFISGYGCTNESEVVVLNHESLESIQVGTKHAASATAMSAHIASTGAGGAAPEQKAEKKAFKYSPPHPMDAGVLPGKMSSKWKKLIVDTAKLGDLTELSKLIGEMKTKSLLHSLKYAQYVKQDLEQKMAAHEAKSAASASSSAQQSGATKKNAHYYKKLKEAVTSHPLYSEPVYKGLKEAGYSNEKILQQWQAQHQKTYGAAA